MKQQNNIIRVDTAKKPVEKGEYRIGIVVDMHPNLPNKPFDDAFYDKLISTINSLIAHVNEEDTIVIVSNDSDESNELQATLMNDNDWMDGVAIEAKASDYYSSGTQPPDSTFIEYIDTLIVVSDFETAGYSLWGSQCKNLKKSHYVICHFIPFNEDKQEVERISKSYLMFDEFRILLNN